VRVVDIDEAQAHLSRLIDEAAGGEPFIIARSGTPLAKVTALDAPARVSSRIGFMAGQVSVPDDFDALGSQEIEQLFGLEP
jgi:prevent-host-death family protein